MLAHERRRARARCRQATTRAGDEQQQPARSDRRLLEVHELEADEQPDRVGEQQQPQRLREQVAAVGQAPEQHQRQRRHRQRRGLQRAAARAASGCDCARPLSLKTSVQVPPSLLRRAGRRRVSSRPLLVGLRRRQAGRRERPREQQRSTRWRASTPASSRRRSTRGWSYEVQDSSVAVVRELDAEQARVGRELAQQPEAELLRRAAARSSATSPGS